MSEIRIYKSRNFISPSNFYKTQYTDKSTTVEILYLPQTIKEECMFHKISTTVEILYLPQTRKVMPKIKESTTVEILYLPQTSIILIGGERDLQQ